MSRITKYSKYFFVLVFSIVSLVNTSFFSIESAKASDIDCSIPGPAVKLALYTTDKSNFTRPDITLDNQSIIIGNTSQIIAVEIEDVNGCPTKPSSTFHGIISFSPGTGDIWSVTQSGIRFLQGLTYNFSVATNGYRKGFEIVPKSAGSVVISATTDTTKSLLTLIPADLIINVDAPAPEISLLTFTNNVHGIADTISGEAGAVPAGAVLPDIKVRAYSDPVATMQLGLDATVALDGSFAPIAIGDDQYRNVTLRAIYPGTPETLSDTVSVGPPIIVYPSIVSSLAVSHESINDKPYLSWDADADATGYMVYRVIYSATPLFTDLDRITPAPITTSYYRDDTYILGNRYSYLVKKVDSTGSYTPEHLPVKDIRIDVTSATVSPQTINLVSVAQSPTVTATVSVDVSTLFISDPTSVKVKFTNPDTGNKTYYAAVTIVGQSLTATAPFIDQATGLASSVLADGDYSSFITAVGPDGSSINDLVQLSNTVMVDLRAPTAPVLSLLKYNLTTTVLSGLAGTVESGTYVYIYDVDPVINPTSLPLMPAFVSAIDGSFISLALNSTAQTFYIRAVDTLGNVGTVTKFDLVPTAPDINLLTMQQNKPGTSDVITGLAGTVLSGVVVNIYNVDPLINISAAPYRTLVANIDGGFSEDVGDNQFSAFWVTVRSGSGLLSSAVKLANVIYANPVTNFSATTGDGKVSLFWTVAPGSSYYTVETYDLEANTLVSTVVAPANQNYLQLLLTNNHNYRFTIISHDLYGNVSVANIVTATPQAPKIVLASISKPAEKVTETPPTPKPVVAQKPKISAPESVVVTPEDTSSKPAEENSRNWAPWILTIGILILLIAGSVAYLLWGKQGEVVVTNKPKAVKENKSSSVEIGEVDEFSAKDTKPKTNRNNTPGSIGDDSKRHKPRW